MVELNEALEKAIRAKIEGIQAELAAIVEQANQRIAFLNGQMEAYKALLESDEEEKGED